MATVYSDFYQSDGTPKFNVTTSFIGASYTTGSLAAADIITMVRVPVNFEVWGGFLTGGDMDTGIETLELDVGISGDTTKFLNSGVITGDPITDLRPVAGIWYPFEMTDLPWKPTSATDLIVTVTADAATEAALSLSLVCYGNYLPPSRS